MNRKMKGLLIGIGAVIVIIILIGAYFASQPEVKWWKPEKELEKPVLQNYPSTIIVYRNHSKSEYIVGINKYIGSISTDKNFRVGIVLGCRSYEYYSDYYDIIVGNLTAWAERLSGDYILQKLVISYKYGSEKEYNFTGIEYTDTSDFEGTHLYFNLAKNHDPYEDDLWWNWYTMHKMTGVNKDKKDADFYGVSFPILIFLDDPLSLYLNHTIIFTVTAYYGHPTLLGWSDMHELSAQVVLKIVPGGEKE